MDPVTDKLWGPGREVMGSSERQVMALIGSSERKLYVGPMKNMALLLI